MVEKQSGLPVYIESVNSSNLRSVMDVSRSEAKLAGVMGNPCRNLGRDQMRPRSKGRGCLLCGALYSRQGLHITTAS